MKFTKIHLSSFKWLRSSLYIFSSHYIMQFITSEGFSRVFFSMTKVSRKKGINIYCETGWYRTQLESDVVYFARMLYHRNTQALPADITVPPVRSNSTALPPRHWRVANCEWAILFSSFTASSVITQLTWLISFSKISCPRDCRRNPCDQCSPSSID